MKYVKLILIAAILVVVILCYVELRKKCDSKSNYTRLGSGRSMSCGGSSLCGTLTIETGLGSGNYGHQGVPGVHGLWPETGNYGSSQCIAPENTTFDGTGNCNYLNDSDNCSGYIGEGPGKSGSFCFPYHEWSKHGQCAGGSGPSSTFFATACQLGAPIVNMLSQHSSWDDMVSAVQSSQWSDYLWDTDTNNKQFEFSVQSNDGGYTWNFFNA